MIHLFKKGLALAAVVVSQMLCGTIAAQDVDINFETLDAEGQRSPYTINGVTFTYIGYSQGADIYMKNSDSFCLAIKSSSKKIARIEFKGEIAASKYNDDIVVKNNIGKLTHLESGTFVWEGLSTNLQFWGNSEMTNYYVKGLRLWFEGSEIITDEKSICATPSMTVKDGEFVFSCPTPDATYHYSVVPKTESDGVTFNTVTLSLYATAPNMDPSEVVKQEFSISQLRQD